MPDITLSSDIIVGFPGETEQDFEQTLQLVEDMQFDLLFTFLYSPRTGTPAASYEDNATPQEKQHRFERLLKAQDDIAVSYTHLDVYKRQHYSGDNRVGSAVIHYSSAVLFRHVNGELGLSCAVYSLSLIHIYHRCCRKSHRHQRLFPLGNHKWNLSVYSSRCSRPWPIAPIRGW